MAPISPTARNRSPAERAARRAWYALLSAAGVFCLLTGALAYGAYRVRTETTDPIAGVVIPDPLFTTTAGVTVRPRGERTGREVPSGQERAVGPGDRIMVAPEAGYGKIASLRFFDAFEQGLAGPGSRIDLWAQASLTLDTMQRSRWSGRIHEISVFQESGYARYDLIASHPFETVTFRVRTPSRAEILLAPGGSYSIAVQPEPRRITSLTGTTPAFTTEVSVREAGVATIVGQRCGAAQATEAALTCRITAGQTIVVGATGIPSLPGPARWEQIRDGRFYQYTELEYNRTTLPLDERAGQTISDTWIVWAQHLVTGSPGRGGGFNVRSECRPELSSDMCTDNERTTAAQFSRVGGQTTPFQIGVRQAFGRDGAGVDISEYRSLRLSADIRVLYQSLGKGGDQGSECPLLIRLWYKERSPTDDDQQRVFCFYAVDAPATGGTLSPQFTNIGLTLNTWYHLDVELRDAEYLPNTLLLKYIEIYASGHDYQSEITNVSLVGLHEHPAP